MLNKFIELGNRIKIFLLAGLALLCLTITLCTIANFEQSHKIVSLGVGYDEVCPLDKAIYKPHKALTKPGGIEKFLILEVVRNQNEEPVPAGLMRNVFCDFSLLDTDDNKVSTLRFGDACSNGIVICGLHTSYGSFEIYDPLLPPNEQGPGMGLSVKALDNQFYSQSYYKGSNAPYIYIFDGAVQLIKTIAAYDDLIYSKDQPFIKYYSEKKVIPDIAGQEVWKLSEYKDDK